MSERKKQMGSGDHVSTGEWARRHGCSREHARKMAASGKLPGAIRVGVQWRIPANAEVSEPVNRCVDCGIDIGGARQRLRCDECSREARRSANRTYRAKNQHVAEFKERQRERAREAHYRNHEQTKEKLRAGARGRFFQDKRAALARYGNVCACCGEQDYRFLTFHHANGDGKEHRISMGIAPRGSSAAFVRKLRLADYPDWPGLTVLCFNCHMAEDLWGGCPHKTERPAGQVGKRKYRRNRVLAEYHRCEVGGNRCGVGTMEPTGETRTVRVRALPVDAEEGGPCRDDEPPSEDSSSSGKGRSKKIGTPRVSSGDLRVEA